MRILILAGGSGTRLWPLSTPEKPKQFCSFLGMPSLFIQTIQRALLLAKPKDIIIVASIHHKKIIEQQCPKEITVIYETEKRNTLGAICFGLRNIAEDVVLVLSADHFIKEEDRFVRACKKAIVQAKEGYFCVFGKKPTKPHAGFGYIQVSSKTKNGFFVTKFVEKPDLEAAQKYMEQGNYFWNLGMFCFLKSTFEHKLKIYQPLWFDYLVQQGAIPDIAISVDHGLLEKAVGIFMVCMDDITWSDVGSFDALFELSQKDEQKNGIVGYAVMHGAQHNFVHLEDIELICIDMQNIAIVQKDRKLLICPIDSAQKVKEVSVVEAISV